MTEPSSSPLVIVGAGIGGVATALALAQRGVEVEILEQAPEIGEIGAGIQLAPNALRVLDQLGVLAEVYDQAVFPPAATMRDATTAEVITRMPFDDDFTRKYGYPYIVTHRSDLHACLVSAALASGSVRIRTGARVCSISQPGNDRVHVELDSGEQLSAGAVIGADGLHSHVRGHVTGGDPVEYVGDYAYRGTVPYDQIAERDGKDDMTWWVGPSMHLIQYPVRRRELYNQVAVFSSARRGDPSSWGDSVEFDRRFVGKHPYVCQGASLITRDRRWEMVDRQPLERWTNGRVALLGDAAHPMVQYLAQGGCQALEDAICLATCLQDDPAVETAFATYQSIRVPRASNVQRWARNMGEIVHADGVPAALRNELLRLRSSKDLPQVEWLYAHQPALVNS